jgi:hypothetical protein
MRGIDSPQLVWKEVESAQPNSRRALTDSPSPGASLFVPLSLAAGEKKTLTLRFAGLLLDRISSSPLNLTWIASWLIAIR